MTIAPPKKFTGLHAHSTYSTYDGLGYPSEHIDYVLENEMDSWALTDHGHMNGYANAYLHTKDKNKKGQNFKFLPGIEAYYHPSIKEWRKLKEDSREEDNDDEESKGVENEEETKSAKYNDPLKRRHHLVLLAKSTKGLESLFKLVSTSHKEGFYRKPRIDMEMLREYGKDIIASSACIGGQPAWYIANEYNFYGNDGKKELIVGDSSWNNVQKNISIYFDSLKEALGEENVFAEMQFNKLELQHYTNAHLMEYSKNSGTKLVATADSHYCRPEFWKDREMYKMLGRLNQKSLENHILPQSVEELKCELYPKNASQMWQTYNDVKNGYSFYDDQIIKDAIERTHDIAHNLIGNIEPDTTVKLPSSVIPQGMTAFAALVDKCKIGLREKHLDNKPEYIERLKEELKVIKDKEFATYFLTMKIIMDIANKTQLAGCGRGSAAGSLINYLLGITQVDPLQYKLLFSRFINPARAEYPDIDCIASEHKILMADGTTKIIKDVSVGEHVIDKDGNSKKILAVKHRISNMDDVVYRLILDINGKIGTIVCNHKHRLFLKDGSVIFVKMIRENDELCLPNGNCKVLQKIELQETNSLTDITVEDTSTFLIIPFSTISFEQNGKFVFAINIYDIDIDFATRQLHDIQKNKFFRDCYELQF